MLLWHFLSWYCWYCCCCCFCCSVHNPHVYMWNSMHAMYALRCAQFVGHTVCFTMSHDNRTWTTCTTIERLIFSVGLSLIWCFDIMMNPIGNNNSECSLNDWFRCLHSNAFHPNRLHCPITKLLPNDDLSFVQSSHSRNSIKIMIVNVIFCICQTMDRQFHLNANNNCHSFIVHVYTHCLIFQPKLIP